MTAVASLIVRNLSHDTRERLRQRATRHKRSLEAEVRAILERAAQGPRFQGRKASVFRTGSCA